MINKSLLFPIEPLGRETGDIEAFPSYLSRLAIKHSVSVVDLCNYLINYDKLFHRFRHSNLPIKALQLAPLVSGFHKTSTFRRVIEELTEVKLRGTSMLMLGWDLRVSYKDISKSFKWCPKCFEEMSLCGIEPYFKLIWLFSSTTYCIEHSTELIERCPHCKKLQGLSARHLSLRYCSSCESDLADSHISVVDRISIAKSGADIAEFLTEYLTTLNVEPSLFGLRESIRDILQYKLTIGIEKAVLDSCSIELNSKSTYSFLNARRIANLFGVSLYDLLTGNFKNSNVPISSELYCYKLPNYLVPKKREGHKHNEIRSRLMNLLKNKKLPYSSKQVARDLNVSIGYLEYRYPDICHSINSKYLEYKKKQRNLVLNNAKLRAVSYFADERYGEYPNSRKSAYKVLREETGLPKFVLISVIEEVYQSLYC